MCNYFTKEVVVDIGQKTKLFFFHIQSAYEVETLALAFLRLVLLYNRCRGCVASKGDSGWDPCDLSWTHYDAHSFVIWAQSCLAAADSSCSALSIATNSESTKQRWIRRQPGRPAPYLYTCSLYVTYASWPLIYLKGRNILFFHDTARTSVSSTGTYINM